MATTYTPLVTSTLGSASSTFTVSSIPTSYTDLVISFTMPSSGSSTNFDMRVGNGTPDSNANYSTKRLIIASQTQGYADGQANNTTGVFGNVTLNSNQAATGIVHLNGYSTGNNPKPILAQCNYQMQGGLVGSGGGIVNTIGSWRSGSAINTVQLLSTSGQLIPAGSIITVYGILGA